MGKTLVIVESPTKAKTLRQFLGKDYLVESSVGHVRDLPANASEVPAIYKKTPWGRLGVNVEDGFKPLYVVNSTKKKKIAELKRMLKEVDKLLLATDEDREGEAISWHLIELLAPKVPYERMVFHEITETAIHAALGETRRLNTDLVQAQEARRIIDRLYGYEVSPILWRKVAPRLSAGRVQSVAIRMLVDRERARMRFKSAQYWDLTATFTTEAQQSFSARLHTIDGQRIAEGRDFDPDTGKLVKEGVQLVGEAQARSIAEQLESREFEILSAEEKAFTRSPAPPFTTSTLQQEGNRKLRFDAKRTMRAAQRLYENGYITYMRTDSVILSEVAIRMARETIESTYGAEYLPEAPRTYKNKVKNAQEAHEAIRPAGEVIAPIDEIRRRLGDDDARIYELVWKRTLASQMRDARGRRRILRVRNVPAGANATPSEYVFQATGNTIDFPGFLRAYVEGADDPAAALAERETILPPVEPSDRVDATLIEPGEHQTTPPARLTEATLVKTLEESGIGRPSTYASIIDTIQRREYTFKKGTALVPTFTAMAVVGLMEEHLSSLIDAGFTARMEDRLDAISRGEAGSLAYLEEFYNGSADGKSVGLSNLVNKKIEDIDARTVCSIPLGTDEEGREVIVRVGKFGPFLQRVDVTASIPNQTCPDEVTMEFAANLIEASEQGEEPIGSCPETGEPVFLKSGRFGPYVQRGLPDDEKQERPKMASLLKGMTLETMTLDLALQLLSLPRTIGKDAEGREVVAHNGRFGPYLIREAETRSLTAEDDLLTIGMERALELFAQEKKGRGFRQAATPLKVFEKVEVLGGADVRLLEGRYGPYVTDGEVNASLPKGTQNPLELTLADALHLLDVQRERKGTTKKKASKRGAKKAAKKSSAKKSASKKSPGKKASSKKSPGKKAAKKTAPKSSASSDDAS